MALFKSGNGGQPGQERVQRQWQPPLMKFDTEQIQFVYLRGEREVREMREVPKALMRALVDPGESKLNPLQAMRELAQFYNEAVTPELDIVVLTGIGSIPAAYLSSMIQSSYRKHAVVAATSDETSQGLFLNDPEVDKYLRTVAALASGKQAEDIQKVAPDKVMLWVGKTTTSIERTVIVKMKTERLVCDRGSHKEEIDVSVPDGTTVEQEQRVREQRLASLPKMKEALDMAFGEIEQKRGQPLDTAERNAVVAHLNVTYIENPNDRLSVIL